LPFWSYAARGSSQLNAIAIARHHFDAALCLMTAAHAISKILARSCVGDERIGALSFGL
jgi:hypothetical protein